MKFNLYRDIYLMYQDTYNILIQNEVLNAILLGNLIIGYDEIEKSGWKNTANWFMATITDNSKIKMIALMTPPYNLTLYEIDVDERYLDCLIDGIVKEGIKLPGVMCEKKLAEKFASKYANKLKLKYIINTNQGIYELEKINPEIKNIGALRSFKKSDWSFIPYWIEAALSDFHGTTINDVDNDINNYSQVKDLYILEDAENCVSMARITREMNTCCCVSMVYTPPYFRNKGYATSCVAKVSQIILDRGYKKCVLYTNLDYPISNNIYKKIGYVHVYNSAKISFFE